MSKQTQCKLKFPSIKIRLGPSTSHQQASLYVSTQQQSIYLAGCNCKIAAELHLKLIALKSRSHEVLIILHTWSSGLVHCSFQVLKVSRELLFLQCWSHFCLSAIAAASSRAFVVLTWIAVHFLLKSKRLIQWSLKFVKLSLLALLRQSNRSFPPGSPLLR